MTTLAEARFEIDRQLLDRAGANNGAMPPVRNIRFFAYPGSYVEWLACAELVDGDEIQIPFELPERLAGDPFDENAIARMFFDVPSSARH